MDLIARLETASGPDRELDNEIARFIGLVQPSDPAGWPPRFSESIDAALTLVPEGYPYGLHDDRRGNLSASVVVPTADGKYESCTERHVGATVAISICIASLRARQST